MSRKHSDRRTTSRRTFLKTSAGLAAGASLPAPASAQDATGARPADPELADLQSQKRILLKGGVVLTMDPQVGHFANADVLIEDGKIREVRPNIAVASAATIDATGRIIVPGFVDTHSHSYQGILRNILTNGRVDPDYNRDIVGRITPAYTPEDAYVGMLATALGMIDMGTTCVVDVSQVNNTPEHSDALINGLQDAGLRAVFAYSAGAAGPGMQHPQDIVRLKRTYFSSRDQLLTLALGIGPDPKMFQVARDNDVPVVAHLRNTLPQRDDGARLKTLAQASLLRPGDEFIHLLHLPPEPLQLIKDLGCHVSLSPAIEMTMGHGIPAIQNVLDAGLPPSLSSDHAVTLSSDMFSMMRMTGVVQRFGAYERERTSPQSAPKLLTCREILAFGTINGARCANVDGKVGTLTPGKEADLLMLKADSIDVWPLNNAYGAVVNLLGTGHVEAVFIAGRVRKWRGKLVGIDLPRVLRSIQQARDNVLQRANFPMELLG
jgi:cytosine/adenosine deaminase-related metal-dependent hydrolase